MSRSVAPYGLWPSPISPASLAQGLRLSDLAWDSDGESIVWLEGRSDRGVVVTSLLDCDAPRDLTSELSVRARVGYGGGELGSHGGQAIYTSGGRLYRQALAGGGQASPITPAWGEAASPVVSPDGRWVLYVHSAEGQDVIALVDVLGSHWPRKVASGDDFYMQPRWHPDGQRIAWIAWNHPNMPWDGSTLYMSELDLTSPGLPAPGPFAVIAGGGDEAVFQPEFSPDGRYLSFISDRTGYDNLYLYDLDTGVTRSLVSGDLDLGVPAWAQGMSIYAWAPDSATMYCVRNERSAMHVWAVDVATGVGSPVGALSPYSSIAKLVGSSSGQLALIASGATIPQRLIVHSPGTGSLRVLARSEGEILSTERISLPEPISWQSTGDEMVHGIFYAPRNADYESQGKPPLLLLVHGGPTGQSLAAYSGRIQFFTTRGWAVLDVNYRGSSGYGRAYRRRLCEMWGISDVDDAQTAAHHVIAQGLVDPERVVIMGGSAGGYTVLQSLIRYPGVFRAGICLYGVTNLFTLATDTHKFEQHYLDSLIGPLPETCTRYRERSPLFHLDRIVDPLAIFQGEEDTVVPRSQADTIVAALRARGVPHEYHVYPGEGHGWRKPETIKSHYESVLTFLKQYVLYA
ncbi:MAG: S9 family peptidase [Anaerolineae bacterium]